MAKKGRSGDESPLVAELKRLRQRSGLALGVRGLAQCPNLLRALDTSDPVEAKAKLEQLIHDVGGDVDPLLPLSLATAYGLWFHEREKVLSPLNPSTLTRRRHSLKTLLDYKTDDPIEDAENAMVAELAARLQRPAGVLDRINVMASASGRRIDRINVIYTSEEDDALRDQHVFWNRGDEESSTSLVYRLPPAYARTCTHLNLLVYWSAPPYPTRSWAGGAPTAHELSFKMGGVPMPVRSGDAGPNKGVDVPYIQYYFTNPLPDFYYAVWWAFDRGRT